MESGLHISLAAERLGTFFGLPITNTILTTWVVMLILILSAILLKNKLTLIPGRMQTAIESAFGYVYSYVESTLESEKLAKRYFPLIATIFLFILTANLLD